MEVNLLYCKLFLKKYFPLALTGKNQETGKRKRRAWIEQNTTATNNPIVHNLITHSLDCRAIADCGENNLRRVLASQW